MGPQTDKTEQLTFSHRIYKNGIDEPISKAGIETHLEKQHVDRGGRAE